MSEFLFHVQWWIPTLLAVIGIALFINGNRQGTLNVALDGISTLSLGGGTGRSAGV